MQNFGKKGISLSYLKKKDRYTSERAANILSTFHCFQLEGRLLELIGFILSKVIQRCQVHLTVSKFPSHLWSLLAIDYYDLSNEFISRRKNAIVQNLTFFSFPPPIIPYLINILYEFAELSAKFLSAPTTVMFYFRRQLL